MRQSGSFQIGDAVKLTMLTSSVILFTVFRMVIDGPSSKIKKPFARFFLDSLTITLPTTLIYTIGEELNSLCLPLLLTCVTVALLFAFRLKDTHLYPSLNSQYRFKAHKIHITLFRSFVSLSTIICILAVDFNTIFPRRHNKTFHLGFSLMDTGVGSFIFMSGVVSPEARNGKLQESKRKMLKKSFNSSFALISIGVIRSFLIRMLEYPRSPYEYGADWNFFLTLASVQVLSSLVMCLLPSIDKVWVLSAGIGVLYEILLSKFNLFDMLSEGFNGRYMHEYEDGIINANREGIFSSIGMLSLHLAGISLGNVLFKSRETFGEVVSLFKKLCFFVVLAWLATSVAQIHIQDASRCYGNLTYVLWSVSHNTSLILLFLLSEIICNITSHIKEGSGLPGDTVLHVPGGCRHCVNRANKQACACLVFSISYNQLFYFILGNLLTGLVNLTVNPHHKMYTSVVQFSCLIAYLTVTNGVTSVMFAYRKKCKFW